MSSTASSTGRVRPRTVPPAGPTCSSVVDLPVVHRDHRDDLLGEHVERVARDAQFLDLARRASAAPPPPTAPGRPGTWGRNAAGHVADVVAGPADALQAAGHRRRRLDLDDQVHRAHVDAEFQAGGGDHGGQPAGLQRLLDLRSAPAGRPSRGGPGRPRRARPPRSPDAMIWAGGAACRRRGQPGLVAACPLGGELVEPGAEPLGQTSGVGEHDRGTVLLDQVEHPLLDVRPDRALGRPGQARARSLGGCVAGGGVQVGHVLDRHHDRAARSACCSAARRS